MLSELVYCERRFYLKIIEQQNNINDNIEKGIINHQNVDNHRIEKRNGLIKVFSLNVYNNLYNLYGIADLIEFSKNKEGIFIDFLNDYFDINLIEYKTGKKRNVLAYNVQLTSQIMCLESMYNCNISQGMIYFTQPKERLLVNIDDKLRKETIRAIDRAKEIIRKEEYIPPKYLKRCNGCSMYDICNPKNILIKKYMDNIKKL